MHMARATSPHPTAAARAGWRARGAPHLRARPACRGHLHGSARCNVGRVPALGRVLAVHRHVEQVPDEHLRLDHLERAVAALASAHGDTVPVHHLGVEIRAKALPHEPPVEEAGIHLVLIRSRLRAALLAEHGRHGVDRLAVLLVCSLVVCFRSETLRQLSQQTRTVGHLLAHHAVRSQPRLLLQPRLQRRAR